MNSVEKRVLIITYYWPPAGGPGIQRVLKFVKNLPHFGWKPVILTVREGDYPAVDPELEKDIPSECTVYRTRILEPYNVYRLIAGKSKDEKIPTFVLNPSHSDSRRDRIMKWIRTHFFIPDARIGWIPFAVSAAKKIIKTEKIDLLFSTSPPQTVQLIARRIANKSGLKWVADFRDPWSEAFWLTEIQKEGIIKKVNQHLEKTVLQTADVVTTVSQGIIDLFQRKADNRFEIIHNGFEQLNNQTTQTNRFTILFFGHLNRYQHRETLFQVLSALPNEMRKQIDIVFIGKVFNDFHRIIQKYDDVQIIVKPYMNYRDLLRYAQKASLLYRPLSNMAYAQGGIGAKTFDYLSLRKPILALGPKDSLIQQILKQTGSGKIFGEHEHDAVGVFIREHFNMWQKNKYILLPRNKHLKEFETLHNVEKLVKIFDQLKD